ncbi:protein of unknown function (DUF3143) [Rubidibacter lacunae KORDI 51-2]|uniref:DUF3143 domain-containing protein n=1 Tax=Rubidibacter lacunae KORDI 51-2 TaxID=582515 RepID=U5DIX8_9CHRO|nr:DUF3143 domain-containing protein [Rubidibacter lacunae]ERN40892.1 protein of unknown function (DUF3143) [Rubidibacter lacunae KORDI 51-2]
MTLPPAETPLYNHPLPDLEQWLRDRGCLRDCDDLHRWFIEQPQWKAEICLDVEEIVVRYIEAGADGTDVNRSFRYSLSRGDVEEAVFSGP